MSRNLTLKYFLVFGLIFHALFVSASEASNTTSEMSLYEQLCVLNKQWLKQEPTIDLLNQKVRFEHDGQLIQTHLQLVEAELRAASTRHLSPQQLANRQKGLDILKDYHEAGVFPINTYHAARTPYFIDNYNTACAVGHIMRESGGEKLAMRIATEANYAYIEDMQYPELGEWAADMGFGVEELKWIQPTYAPPISIQGTVANATCSEADGSISVSASAIDPTVTDIYFLYEWEHGVSGAEVDGLAFGEYCVTATAYHVDTDEPVQFQGAFLSNEGYACFQVGNVGAPRVTAEVTDALCPKSGGGSITTDVTGGTAPYTYAWTYIDPTTLDAEVISNDPSLTDIDGDILNFIDIGFAAPIFNYELVITDANGCKAFYKYQVKATNDIPYISNFDTEIRQISCEQNGYVRLGTVYGVEPFTYAWTGPDNYERTTQYAYGMDVPGTYTVVVTDSVGCQLIRNFEIVYDCASPSIAGWQGMPFLGERKISFPTTYNAYGLWNGEDTYGFSNTREDNFVDFSLEIGPGTPYVQAELTEPLPATHKGHEQFKYIYSFADPDRIIGAFYYTEDDGTDFREASGIFLPLLADGVTYQEQLFVSFAFTAFEEVCTIFSTLIDCKLGDSRVIYEGLCNNGLDTATVQIGLGDETGAGVSQGPSNGTLTMIDADPGFIHGIAFQYMPDPGFEGTDTIIVGFTELSLFPGVPDEEWDVYYIYTAFTCAETCENPLANIPYGTCSAVTQYDFEGREVFFVEDCGAVADGGAYLYECDGTEICRFGTIVGATGEGCPSFPEEATLIEVLQSCAGCNNCFCTEEYAPVCVDGETFGNACEAECAGYSSADWTMGVCEDIECPPLSLCVIDPIFPYYPKPINLFTDQNTPIVVELPQGVGCDIQYYEFITGIASYDLIEAPVNGTVTVNGTEVTYQPNPDFVGIESFMYEICFSLEPIIEQCYGETSICINRRYKIAVGDVECPHPEYIREDAFCPTDYNPVCACDNITYSNDCEAWKAGALSWTSGPCEPCVCDDVYAPVCVNGITFNNSCEAECAGYADADVEWVEGVCPEDCPPMAVCDIYPYQQPMEFVIEANDTVYTTVRGNIDFCNVSSQFYEDQISFEITNEPANGSVIVDGNDITYVPNFNYEGLDRFSYRACYTLDPAAVACYDFLDSTDCATVTIDIAIGEVTCPDPDFANNSFGCPEYYSPVCACNGITYDNDCMAWEAGALYWSYGPCEAACNVEAAFDYELIESISTDDLPTSYQADTYDFVDASTGNVIAWEWSFHNFSTSEDQYPEPVTFDMIVDGEAQGPFEVCLTVYGADFDCTDTYCIEIPAVPVDCICPLVYAPVCGADGVTYGNACQAACAGVEVVEDGPCTDCVCPTIYAPVCGSNGRTYSNACFAECAGVIPEGEGDCPPVQTVVICPGDSVQIGFPYIPNTLYNWSPDTDISCTNCSQPHVSPSETTLYELETTVTVDFVAPPVYQYFQVIVDEECDGNAICCQPGFCGVEDPLEIVWMHQLIDDASVGESCVQTIDKICHNGETYFLAINDYQCLTGGDPNIVVDYSDALYNCAGDIVCYYGFLTDEECVDIIGNSACRETIWELNPGCDCPEIYAPVCGVDGITYDNECFAHCAGIDEFVEGVCEGPICDVEDPINNLPWLEALVDSLGEEILSITAYDYNGQTVFVVSPQDIVVDAPSTVYDCEGNIICFVGFLDSTDCPDFYQNSTNPRLLYENYPCFCPIELGKPVCGEDGVTYPSACEAECAGVAWSEGACCRPNYNGNVTVDDFVEIAAGSLQAIDVLDNDNLNGLPTYELVIFDHPQHGDANIVAVLGEFGGIEIQYAPFVDYVGFDSFTYAIQYTTTQPIPCLVPPCPVETVQICEIGTVNINVIGDGTCIPTTHAIMTDYTGLDGCGFVLESENGTLEVADAPDNFVFEEGKEVLISYIVRTDLASICQVGPIVDILCFEDITPPEDFDHIICNTDTLIFHTGTSIAQSPANGTAYIEPLEPFIGELTYIPNPGFVGVDTIITSVPNDVIADDEPANYYTTHVILVEDCSEPINYEEEFACANDTTVFGVPLGFGGTVIHEQPVNGTATLGDEFNEETFSLPLTYIPNPGFVGVDTMVIAYPDDFIIPGEPQGAFYVTYLIHVEDCEEPAVIYEEMYPCINQAVTAPLEIGNDYAIIVTPSNGTVGLDSGDDPTTSVTYVPNPDFVGIDTFQLEVRVSSTYTYIAIYTVFVDPCEEPETIYKELEVCNDLSAFISFPAPVNGGYYIASPPQIGTLEFEETPFGNYFTYLPDNDYVGIDTFVIVEYLAPIDGDEMETFYYYTVNVNDCQPENLDYQVIEACSNTSNNFDIGLGFGGTVITTPPTNGTANIEFSTAQLVYTPNLGFVGTDTLVIGYPDDFIIPDEPQGIFYVGYIIQVDECNNGGPIVNIVEEITICNNTGDEWSTDIGIGFGGTYIANDPVGAADLTIIDYPQAILTYIPDEGYEGLDTVILAYPDDFIIPGEPQGINYVGYLFNVVTCDEPAPLFEYEMTTNPECDTLGNFTVGITVTGGTGSYGAYDSYGEGMPEFFHLEEGVEFFYTGSAADAENGFYTIYIYDRFVADVAAEALVVAVPRDCLPIIDPVDCLCPLVYAPVCGEDGITYGNACQAECEGVAYTDGACGDTNPEPPCTMVEEFAICTDLNTPVTICPEFCGEEYKIRNVRSKKSDGMEIIDQCVLYTPKADYTGDDVLRIRVCDADGNCKTIRVNITVGDCDTTDENNAPIAENDRAVTDTGDCVRIAVLENDSDPDGDNFKITSHSETTEGTLNLVGNIFRYCPADGFSGRDRFSYQVCDEFDNCSEATVEILVNGIVAINPEADVNLRPCVQESICTQPVTPIIVCPTFCNLEGDIQISSARAIFNCSIEKREGACIQYTALPAFAGEDNLEITGCDMNGNCETVSITVNVGADCGDGVGKATSELESFTSIQGLQLNRIYPTPVDHTANIQFTIDQAQEVAVEVFDMSGKLILSDKLQAVSGAQIHELNTTNLSAGMYILHLRTETGSVADRLMKQ